MDLTQLQGAEEGFLHLEHPSTREPLYEGGKPVGFKMASRFSKLWRQKTAEMQNSSMNRRKKATAERMFHEQNELLASLILGVENLSAPGAEGQPEKVTPKNVADLVFANHRLSWVREQVDEYVMQDADFFPSA